MIDDKIAKAKTLIEQRERIDRELAALFGLTEPSKRGRPRKDNNPGEGAKPTSEESTGHRAG